MYIDNVDRLIKNEYMYTSERLGYINITIWTIII